MAEANNTDQLRAALEQMIAAMPPKAQEAPQPQPEYGTARGVLASVNQGMTFGFSDEMVAGIRALVLREEGEDYSTAYKRHRDQVRGRLDEFREYAPWTSTLSEIGGAMLGPGKLAKLLKAQQFIARGSRGITRVGRAGVVGAVEGTIYGAGVADELSDVPRGAATGAAIGGAAGAAVPMVLGAAGAVARGVTRTGAPSFGADFRLAQAMSRDNKSPEEISRKLIEARRLGRPATVADVAGKNVRNELEGAVQYPGAAAQIGEEFLEKRNKDQLQRLSRDLVRATGVNQQDIYSVIDDTMRTRKAAATPVYQQAMQYQAEMNPAVVQKYDEIVNSRLGVRALRFAKDSVNATDKQWDELPLMVRIDAVKKGIDDIIYPKRGSAPGPNTVRQYTEMLRTERGDGLLDLVDTANPTYRQAREIWEDPTRYMRSIEDGTQILAPKNTASLVRRQWNSLNENQREAYRIGALDAIIGTMRRNTAKEPNLLKVIRSPEVRDRLEIIMEPAAFRRLERVLDLEETMFEVGAETLKNSATARRRAVQEEMRRQGMLIGVLSALKDLATLDLRAFMLRGVPHLTEMTQAGVLGSQNKIIVERLLSGTPTATNRMATTAAQVSPRATAAAIAPSVAATVGSGE